MNTVEVLEEVVPRTVSYLISSTTDFTATTSNRNVTTFRCWRTQEDGEAAKILRVAPDKEVRSGLLNGVVPITVRRIMGTFFSKMNSKVVFSNGRIFATSSNKDDEPTLEQCMVIDGSRIVYVGKEADEHVQSAIKARAKVIDLHGRVITPSFIDSHTHLLFFGLSLQKLDLTLCTSLEDIRQAISEFAKTNLNLPRLLCRGWLQPSTNGMALASMIDDLDPRPMFVEALDLHSTWCNTAALNELPIEEMKRACGDHVATDKDGHATGLLAESAQFGYVWPHLSSIATPEDKSEALQQAFKAYVEAGYTGVIDMAMDLNAWDALKRYREQHGIPMHIAAHWFIAPEETAEKFGKHIEEAIAKNREWSPSKQPDFCVVGVKFVSDGVVDGCTAALSHPYGGMKDLVKPLWSSAYLNIAVKQAVSAGLQCAIHAIGDQAITNAVDAIAAVNTPHGRHRIEHLELASAEDAKRLGKLGITASVQPVHSDPHLLKAYPKLIGAKAFERAFPFKEFLDGHACVALGTDAPTARHLPLPNLYNATTRKSAVDPQLPDRTNPDNALTLSQSVIAYTAGAAYSRFAETWTGSIRAGLQADFVVLDTEWTAESLLESKVYQTWYKGQLTYEAKE